MPSTNTHAWHLISKGAQSGLIITNNQYKGRGQRKNKWISSIHGAITFSLFINLLPYKIDPTIAKKNKNVRNPVII